MTRLTEALAFGGHAAVALLLVIALPAAAMPVPRPPVAPVLVGPIVTTDAVHVEAVNFMADCGRGGRCALRIGVELFGSDEEFSLRFAGTGVHAIADVAVAVTGGAELQGLALVGASACSVDQHPEREDGLARAATNDEVQLTLSIAGHAQVVIELPLRLPDLDRAEWWGFVIDPTNARHAVMASASGGRHFAFSIVVPSSAGDSPEVEVEVDAPRIFDELVVEDALPAIDEEVWACIAGDQLPARSATVSVSRRDLPWLHGGPRFGVAYWPNDEREHARARIGWDFARRPAFYWPELILEAGPDDVSLVPALAIATPHALILPSPAARIGVPIELGPSPALGVRLQASAAMFMAEFGVSFDAFFRPSGTETRTSIIIDLSI